MHRGRAVVTTLSSRGLLFRGNSTITPPTVVLNGMDNRRCGAVTPTTTTTRTPLLGRRWLATTHKKRKKAKLASAMAKQNANKKQEKTTADDPPASVLDGGVNLSKMSVRDLKAALDYRKIKYGQDDDVPSLRKLVIAALRIEHQSDATSSQELRDFAEAHGEVNKYLPCAVLALSQSITGLEKEVPVFVPLWDFEKAVDLANKGFFDFGTTARKTLVDHFEQERTFSRKFTPRDIGDVVCAALDLFFCGGDGVRRVMDMESEKDSFQYMSGIVNESPIPKGWTHTPPPELPQDVREKITAAIEDVRRRLGEH